VDIISRDLYPEAHSHTSQKAAYDELLHITPTPKITTIGEIGVLPDTQAIHDEKAGWAAFMVWSKVFCLTEEFNSFDMLKKVYNSPCSVTLDSLPGLY
ncbi:MAG: beta-mannosidase, partial [Ruminococcus sp.]|nr:beta-mannosidase [Ruminococcus sp.]